MSRAGLALAVLAALLALAAPARALDAGQTFRKGAFVISGEAGGGHQSNLENHTSTTGLALWYLGVRGSILPFSPLAKGTVVHGSFEAGLEALMQRYESPVSATFGGLGMAFRYHFLALGRLVPYLEVAAFAGGTDLEVREIRSDFTFLLYGGGGLSFFLTDRTALYAGYRMVHVSNGNISSPNRGFEADTGVMGVSFFLP